MSGSTDERSKLITIHIEHRVHDFSVWKAAFDRDPIDRPGSGVRSYRVWQPVGDDQRIVVDLDVDDMQTAEAIIAMLERLWDSNGAVPALMDNETPRVRLLNLVEQQTSMPSVYRHEPVQKDDRPDAGRGPHRE